MIVNFMRVALGSPMILPATPPGDRSGSKMKTPKPRTKPRGTKGKSKCKLLVFDSASLKKSASKIAVVPSADDKLVLPLLPEPKGPGEVVLGRLAERHCGKSLRRLAEIDAARGDYPRAIVLYEMASVKGCLEATSEVSFIYEHGLLGAAKDDQAALSYLKIAAEGGHAGCTWRLARAFKKGHFGLPKDLDEAALYMMRAEALGNEFAGFELAKACESAPCYGLGSSVPRDDAKALHLYAKYERYRMTAARVQFRPGEAHERGELGFSIDNSKALEYYERAIVGGSYAGIPEALFCLAKAHELGGLGKEVD